MDNHLTLYSASGIANEAAQNQQRVLIVTAVEAEKEAVLRGLGADATSFEVIVGGVGPAAAAASTAAVLSAAAAAGAAEPYRAVISAGIGGGFADRAPVGSLVVANAAIAADLGAETAEGFTSVDGLGFGSARAPVAAEWADRYSEALQAAGLPVQTGAILTLSTVTGTAETAAALKERHPDAAAEAMEGYGVAEAARQHSLPFLEVRAISNAVGPRDRSSWKIKEALDALEAASALLQEVF